MGAGEDGQDTMKSKYTRKPDRGELHGMYADEKMTLKKIGDIFETSPSTVLGWIKAANIKTRSQSESGLHGKRRPRNDELYNMYITENMSLTEIGECAGFGASTISRWMESAGIDTRALHETSLQKNPLLGKDSLYKLYIVDRMDTMEIGKLLGVSYNTVGRWLDRADIKRRSRSDRQLKNCIRPEDHDLFRWYMIDGLTMKAIGNKLGTYAATIQSWLVDAGIEPHPDPWRNMRCENKPPKEKLYEMYEKNKMYAHEISAEFGVSKASIYKWLREYGIRIRNISEYRGERSWNWRGGRSSIGYCHLWNEELREHIREKYNRLCFLCNATEEDNGQRLSVHHIDGNRLQGCEGHDWNLVPLCKRCHGKTVASTTRYYWYMVIMCKLHLEYSAQFYMSDVCCI